MKTIYKYPLTAPGHNTVQMPKGAIIRAAQTQHGILCLWAEVDTEAEVETISFQAVDTGHELLSYEEFIGTVQQGPFVWHIYKG